MDQPRELNRLEIVHSLRIANREAVAATVHQALTTGAIQTGFALWLGASDVWLGILAGIPTFCQLLQIPSAIWVERRGERKWFTVATATLSRSFWLPILFVPLLAPEGLRFSAFIALFLAASVLATLPGPAYTSWMSDLVPAQHRGRYFSQRNMIAGFTTTALSLPAGWFLDLASSRHVISRELAFGVLFAIAVIFGLVSGWLLSRQLEPPMTVMEGSNRGWKETWAGFALPFRDRLFRPFLAFGGLFALGQFFAAPFYIAYALDTLHLAYAAIQALAALQSLTMLACLPLWGFLSDKYGHRPLLTLAVSIVGLTPLCWFLTRADMPWLMWTMLVLVHVLGGLGWAGVQLTQLNLLIAEAPADRKPVYVGSMSAIVGVFGGLAPVLGGLVVAAMPGPTLAWYSFPIGQYKVAFLLSASFRFISLLPLYRFRTSSVTSATEVLSRIGSTDVKTWRAVRSLQPGASEQVRRDAARTLREARNTLALDELISALDDPSLTVREEAAHALGDIQDQRAVPALIAHLDDPATGIVGVVASSLGKLGDSRASASLVNVLSQGSAAERIAAARALGRIGDPVAAAGLMEALRDEELRSRTDVLEAIAAAVARADVYDAASDLVPLLGDASRSLRLAVVRALGDIGNPNTAESILSLLKDEEDPGIIAHASVALAMMNIGSACPAILQAVERIESPVARKQMLHAVASLAGNGDAFYSLVSQESFARDGVIAQALAPSELMGEDETLDHRQRALDCYLREDYSGSILALSASRSGVPSDPSAAPIFVWCLQSAQEGRAGLPEFLLALVALGMPLGA